MDPVTFPASSVGCTCGCPCCHPSTWRRSVKRKFPPEIQSAAAAASVGGGGAPHDDVPARVEMENEVAALRETLSRQQQTIQELCAELEQEQNASSTAASEAMSMILRLQREKAEVQLESRQFKRFAEERMAHDQQELAALDDLLYKREQAVKSLSCEIKAYKHRLLSYGIDEDVAVFQSPEPDHDAKAVVLPPSEFDLPEFDYPPLRCTARGDYDGDEDDDNVDLDKYTPTTMDRIQKLESRIYELETTTGSSSQVKLMDDGSDREFQPEYMAAAEDNSSNGSDGGDDDGSARIYTIDAVHGSLPMAGVSDEDEDYSGRQREMRDDDKVGVDSSLAENGDINKLNKRLQALEADRESMRQAIVSMRTEKAQLVLLKEIAQHLCKEVAPEKRIMKKPSLLATFRIVAVVKWVMSFIFWRKKASRSKYSFGLSKNNVGLLLLLDKSSQVNPRRCRASTQG